MMLLKTQSFFLKILMEFSFKEKKLETVEEDEDLPVPGVHIIDVDAQGEEDGTLISLSVKVIHGTITLGLNGKLPEGVYVLSGKNGGSSISLRTTLKRAKKRYV